MPFKVHSRAKRSAAVSRRCPDHALRRAALNRSTPPVLDTSVPMMCPTVDPWGTPPNRLMFHQSRYPGSPENEAWLNPVVVLVAFAQFTHTSVVPAAYCASTSISVHCV